MLGQILKCPGTNASLIKHMWFLDTSLMLFLKGERKQTPKII